MSGVYLCAHSVLCVPTTSVHIYIYRACRGVMRPPRVSASMWCTGISNNNKIQMHELNYKWLLIDTNDTQSAISSLCNSPPEKKKKKIVITGGSREGDRIYRWTVAFVDLLGIVLPRCPVSFVCILNRIYNQNVHHSNAGWRSKNGVSFYKRIEGSFTYPIYFTLRVLTAAIESLWLISDYACSICCIDNVLSLLLLLLLLLLTTTITISTTIWFPSRPQVVNWWQGVVC